MALSQDGKPVVERARVGSDVAGLVLAAGKGTRMKSQLPKVLHPVAGRPMIGWTLNTLAQVGVSAIGVVISDDQPQLVEYLRKHCDLAVATQKNRLGTGDAVAAASGLFAHVEAPSYAAGDRIAGRPMTQPYVLIMAGDVPGVRAESLQKFIAATYAANADLAVLGMRVPHPHGYGRMVTNGSELTAIIEEKDADVATRAITLCNTGIMLARVDALFAALRRLTPNNAQKEYYLTDCVGHARALGYMVCAHESMDWQEFSGINDRVQLAAVEAWLMTRKRHELMAAGVTVQLPESVYVEDTVEVGADSVIGSGCHLSGSTKIGGGCVIGAGSVLRNVTIAAGERVPPLSVRIS